jgi:hypothetical protein
MKLNEQLSKLKQTPEWDVIVMVEAQVVLDCT